METALTPCVPVPRPLCVLRWHPVGLKSGSWGHRLGSELRTRAALWLGHPFLPHTHPRIPTKPLVLTEMSGDWMRMLLQPFPAPRSSPPAALQRLGGGRSEPNPRPSCLQHQFPASPREAGKIIWERDQLHHVLIPMQNEHARSPSLKRN